MLELSFQAANRGPERRIAYRELVPELEKDDIYRDGRQETYEAYESYKTPKQ
jgi:hypothetical protein